MPNIPQLRSSRPDHPPGKRTSHRFAALLLAVGLAGGAVSVMTAFAASPASAASACDPGSDTCVVIPGTVQTPLGSVTVAVSAGNVVTVQLTPATPGTLALGIPFAFPPGPPTLTGYTRTTVTTSCGLVNIDTFQIPPGPPGRFTLPNLAVISIHPPSPCRVRVIGTTVVFTPIYPPGPPC